MIEFVRFPMPNSSNKLYSSVRGRLIKSAEARKFDQNCEFWAKIYKRSIERQKLNLEAIIENGGHLNVSCLFVFHKNRLIGKKGQLKRLDASNRIKQCHDNLAKILSIDDTLFVCGEFAKITCEDQKDEQVIIRIKETKLGKFEDL